MKEDKDLEQENKGEMIMEQEVNQMNPIMKLVNVVIAPTKAFQAVKEKPGILIPLIILPLFPILYYVLFWNNYEVQLIQMLEKQMSSMGMELTQEMLDLQLGFAKWTTPIGAVVGLLIGAAFGALIYWAIMKLMKSEVTYKQTFSMLLHASAVTSLLWVLHMLLTLVMGDSNILEPMTSLASLLPESMYGTPIYGIALTLELFSIWYLIVLYKGLEIVGGLSKKKAIILTALSYTVTTLLSVSSYLVANLLG